MQFDLFEASIIHHVQRFSEVAARTINAILSVPSTVGKSELVVAELTLDRKLLISILFTGTVYGEYVISMDEEVAASLIGETLEGKDAKSLEKLRLELSDTFCELLNVIVGESVETLGQQFEKLTITAPRVHFGGLKYPKIKTGRSSLSTPKGPIDCYFYVDRMKLDIATSYREALDSLIKANSSLQAALERLQEQQALLVQSEKMAALGTMAAGIAHEINTPLATINFAINQLQDLIEENDLNRPLSLKMLDRAERTILHISKITNSLGVFAEGFQKELFVTTPFKDILKITLDSCLDQISAHHITLNAPHLSDSLALECMASQVSLVLLNLISNSIDAIETLNEKWIRIEIKDLGDAIETRIIDSGNGISEAIQGKVFDPFFTTKKLGTATGLGLSLSKGIVAVHNGTIQLDSTSPHTCFVIQLPKNLKARVQPSPLESHGAQ